MWCEILGNFSDGVCWLGLPLGTLASPHNQKTYLLGSLIASRCECVCEWFHASRCQPWDELMTFSGCTLPLPSDKGIRVKK